MEPYVSSKNDMFPLRKVKLKENIVTFDAFL